MITYINGSPKLNNSASELFLNDIKSKDDKIYYVYKKNYNEIIKSLDKSDTIVFAFPLYADSPTSGILEFFEYLKNNSIDLKNKNLYAIINCGFFESFHNEIAFDIVRCFCKNNNINYKGGFSIGAGPIVGMHNKNLLYKTLTIPYFIKKNKFKKKILNKEECNFNASLLLTKRIYVYAANISWKKQIKENMKNKK